MTSALLDAPPPAVGAPPEWIEPTDGGTRRELLVTAAGMVVLGVSGCDDDAPDPAGGTRRVRHALGTTAIAGKPQRVVTLGVSDADIAVALGTMPVGIHAWYGFDPGVGRWAEGELARLEREHGARPRVWKGPEFSFEGIAATRPDLILYVTHGGQRQTYDKLSQIAPTVGLPEGAAPYAAPWAAATRLIADAMGRRAAGERLVRATRGYLAGVARTNPSFRGATVTYLDISGSSAFFGGETSTVISLMRELGFQTAPYVRRTKERKSQNSIASELLPRIDADALLIYSFGASKAELLNAHPSLRGLRAIKEDRVHLLRDVSLSAPSVLSIPYGIDAVVPFLRRATN